MSQYYNPKENEDWFLVAQAHGFRNWKTIYDHPENEQLRNRRDPYALSPSDKIFIPDKQPMEHQCETAKRYTFTLPTPLRPFSLDLEDDDGEPYGGVKYELWIDGEKFIGRGESADQVTRTNDEGVIQAQIPLVDRVEVRVWYDKDTESDPQAFESYDIEPGHLDPIDTIEGVQHRLETLGYSIGFDQHGDFGEGTKAALISFQEDFELAPSGEIDDDTKDALFRAADENV
jgi:hypothetical protein